MNRLVEPLKQEVLPNWTQGLSMRGRCFTCELSPFGTLKKRRYYRLDSHRALKNWRFSMSHPIILFSVLTQCYYLHTSRELVSPVCRVLTTFIAFTGSYIINNSYKWFWSSNITQMYLLFKGWDKHKNTLSLFMVYKRVQWYIYFFSKLNCTCRLQSFSCFPPE